MRTPTGLPSSRTSMASALLQRRHGRARPARRRRPPASAGGHVVLDAVGQRGRGRRTTRPAGRARPPTRPPRPPSPAARRARPASARRRTRAGWRSPRRGSRSGACGRAAAARRRLGAQDVADGLSGAASDRKPYDASHSSSNTFDRYPRPESGSSTTTTSSGPSRPATSQRRDHGHPARTARRAGPPRGPAAASSRTSRRSDTATISSHTVAVVRLRPEVLADPLDQVGAPGPAGVDRALRVGADDPHRAARRPP